MTLKEFFATKWYKSMTIVINLIPLFILVANDLLHDIINSPDLAVVIPKIWQYRLLKTFLFLTILVRYLKLLKDGIKKEIEENSN